APYPDRETAAVATRRTTAPPQSRRSRRARIPRTLPSPRVRRIQRERAPPRSTHRLGSSASTEASSGIRRRTPLGKKLDAEVAQLGVGGLHPEPYRSGWRRTGRHPP